MYPFIGLVMMADKAVATAGVGTGLAAVASSAVEAELVEQAVASPVGRWVQKRRAAAALVGQAVANPAVGSRVRRAVAASVAGRAFVGSVTVVHRASAVVRRAMEAAQRPGPEWQVQCV